ncbi:hypothetical protein B0T14DRAFT_593012 [Immersiella caudata]|uniref:Uncharacterized protein n=1 Tax=Immersiella caudata TaxID=314043 RepID=A0AA39WFP8_9PEZI|nr:hypothetical protein B0T14DRAFT_593012 [Immersiella caudata]
MLFLEMGNTCSADVFCEYNGSLVTPIPFDADPDIAGIGVLTERFEVIASFLVSAWLTYAVALYTYCSIKDTVEDDPYGTRLDWLLFEHIDLIRNRLLAAALKLYTFLLRRRPVFRTPEPYDALCKHLGNMNRKFPWGKRTLVTKGQMENICLMFSDQQLVTGASILIVGYVRHCEITQYHFYVVCLLGLMSFATFQSVVLIIRGRIRQKLKRGWRFAWITTLFGCALVTNFVIYNDNFLAIFHFGLKMQCIWMALPGDFTKDQLPYVIIGVLMDVWSYFSIIGYLYPEVVRTQPFRGIITITSRVLRAPAYLYIWTWKRTTSRIIRGCAYVLFLVSFTMQELLASLYVDLIRIFAYLYQTTLSIKWARGRATANGREGEEDSWGFGQILPMLLLALPVLAFAEAIVSDGQCLLTLPGSQGTTSFCPALN